MIYKFNKESIYNKYSEIINFGRNGNIIEMTKASCGRGCIIDVMGLTIFGSLVQLSAILVRFLLCPVMQRSRTERESIIFIYILPYSIIYNECLKGHPHLKLY